MLGGPFCRLRGYRTGRGFEQFYDLSRSPAIHTGDWNQSVYWGEGEKRRSA